MLHKSFLHRHLRIFAVRYACMKFYALAENVGLLSLIKVLYYFAEIQGAGLAKTELEDAFG